MARDLADIKAAIDGNLDFAEKKEVLLDAIEAYWLARSDDPQHTKRVIRHVGTSNFTLTYAGVFDDHILVFNCEHKVLKNGGSNSPRSPKPIIELPPFRSKEDDHRVAHIVRKMIDALIVESAQNTIETRSRLSEVGKLYLPLYYKINEEGREHAVDLMIEREVRATITDSASERIQSTEDATVKDTKYTPPENEQIEWLEEFWGSK